MAYLVVFGPLVAAIVAGLFHKQIGVKASQLITTGLTILAALASIWLFFDVAVGGNERTYTLATWMAVGAFDVSWAIKLDTLSTVMLVVVTSVSSLVHVYSWGYMADDPHRPRFFAYLSLFTFAMLSLVTADNFLQMFFGWEGVGLASYLLIGFWYKKESANAAAIKAFVTNRVGDFGLALGVMAVFYVFGTVSFDEVFAAAPGEANTILTFFGLEFAALELIALLLFIGAMGKSAQFFLHVWLPDAMEGPTPVSALIHAATMVTAGVFLVCRCFPIYELADGTSAFITVIGLVTALFAATVGLAQNDIKRVIAYSTCSQLGYMFFAAGLGLYSAAMFHLFTHAFFKALLFLGAGSVIHGLHHEQDMRQMGGTWRKLPITYAMMLIGTLALTGVGLPLVNIGFAGFYSKDMIIEEAFMAGAAGIPFGYLAFLAAIIAAGLTSFYSWRLIFFTFHGKFRGPQKTLDHAHESPHVMLVPLYILAAGAVLAGFFFRSDFVGAGALDFWGGSLPPGPYAEGNYGPGAEGHHPPIWVLFSPVVVTVIGFALAYWFYVVKEGLPAKIAAQSGPLHRFLSNKWYFDEIYDVVFVRGTRALGDLFWKGGDQRIIDGLGPNGVATAVMSGARRVARLQTGYLYHYAFVMLIGVLGLTIWLIAGAGGQ